MKNILQSLHPIYVPFNERVTQKHAYIIPYPLMPSPLKIKSDLAYLI